MLEASLAEQNHVVLEKLKNDEVLEGGCWPSFTPPENAPIRGLIVPYGLRHSEEIAGHLGIAPTGKEFRLRNSRSRFREPYNDGERWRSRTRGCQGTTCGW